jgi:hypothetical protein
MKVTRLGQAEPHVSRDAFIGIDTCQCVGEHLSTVEFMPVLGIGAAKRRIEEQGLRTALFGENWLSHDQLRLEDIHFC